MLEIIVPYLTRKPTNKPSPDQEKIEGKKKDIITNENLKYKYWKQTSLSKSLSYREYKDVYNEINLENV